MDKELLKEIYPPKGCYPCNPGKLGYLEDLCDLHKFLLHFHTCKQCNDNHVPHFTLSCDLGDLIHACGDCIDKGLA